MGRPLDVACGAAPADTSSARGAMVDSNNSRLRWHEVMGGKRSKK